MKGSQVVIDYLNFLLKGELAARDQYFIHSCMYSEWGYSKLFAHTDHEMQEETQHADALMRRILILEGTPDMRPDDVKPGHDIPSMLKVDLDVEMQVRANLKKGIAICEKEGDYVSREILRVQLDDTEQDHAHWLEQQLGLIEKMGLQNYLQAQI